MAMPQCRNAAGFSVSNVWGRSLGGMNAGIIAPFLSRFHMASFHRDLRHRGIAAF
jgi:hypothetical protein